MALRWHFWVMQQESFKTPCPTGEKLGFVFFIRRNFFVILLKTINFCMIIAIRPDILILVLCFVRNYVSIKNLKTIRRGHSVSIQHAPGPDRHRPKRNSMCRLDSPRNPQNPNSMQIGPLPPETWVNKPLTNQHDPPCLDNHISQSKALTETKTTSLQSSRNGPDLITKDQNPSAYHKKITKKSDP